MNRDPIINSPAPHGRQVTDRPAPDRHGSNGRDRVVDVHLRALYYGDFKAVRDTSLGIERNTVTAFIGPSG